MNAKENNATGSSDGFNFKAQLINLHSCTNTYNWKGKVYVYRRGQWIGNVDILALMPGAIKSARMDTSQDIEMKMIWISS